MLPRATEDAAAGHGPLFTHTWLGQSQVDMGWESIGQKKVSRGQVWWFCWNITRIDPPDIVAGLRCVCRVLRIRFRCQFSRPSPLHTIKRPHPLRCFPCRIQEPRAVQREGVGVPSHHADQEVGHLRRQRSARPRRRQDDHARRRTDRLLVRELAEEQRRPGGGFARPRVLSHQVAANVTKKTRFLFAKRSILSRIRRESGVPLLRSMGVGRIYSKGGKSGGIWFFPLETRKTTLCWEFQNPGRPRTPFRRPCWGLGWIVSAASFPTIAGEDVRYCVWLFVYSSLSASVAVL